MTKPFQHRVNDWMLQCFSPEIANDSVERSDRFIEEALELVQACGYSADRAHALVDYVFNRPVGETIQEVGGVMITLATLAHTQAVDMMGAGEMELARISQPEIMAKIRAKQAAKPAGSALPQATLATLESPELPTIRDRFAMAIVNGMITSLSFNKEHCPYLAYEVADLMLEARAK